MIHADINKATLNFTKQEQIYCDEQIFSAPKYMLTRANVANTIEIILPSLITTSGMVVYW